MHMFKTAFIQVNRIHDMFMNGAGRTSWRPSPHLIPSDQLLDLQIARPQRDKQGRLYCPMKNSFRQLFKRFGGLPL